MLKKLQSNGFVVYAVAPSGRALTSFEKHQIRFIHWPLSRQSLNPLTAILHIIKLWKIYRKTKTQLAQHFTVKPNVYGPIAARLAGVAIVVSSVEGLGYLFTANDVRANLIRPIVTILYKLAFSLTDVVIFQNKDDISVLRKLSVLPQNKVKHIPGGVGVNTAIFNSKTVSDETKKRLRKSIGLPNDGIIFVLAARMLWHKGVAEFVECARIIRKRNNAHFLLVGPVDTGNPSKIPISTLKGWHAAGHIQYLGERNDVRDLLGLADVLMLPSFYREGTPTILLEGSAMGKPIITTDFPGCREVVEHNTNGILVPPKNVAALVSAVQNLLESPELRTRLGVAGRRKAVLDFDEEKINGQFMELYKTLLQKKGLLTSAKGM